MIKFGSSGIRGKANKEISPQTALTFGNAVGNLYPEAIVAHDTRVSALMIEMAVVSGLLSAGCRVITGGLMPTPTLAIASKQYGCGIMITASHNPAEDIGIKIFKDGASFNTEKQTEVERQMNSGTFNYADWNRTGDLLAQDNKIAIEVHKKLVLKHIKASGLKVVLDCGCGAGSVISPYLLRELGCKVVTINSQPDGFFPGRDPEPRDDTLDVLKRTVVSCGADVGIAHDGDADRIMAVDNNGVFVSGDKLLALFALNEARTSISIPIDTSNMVTDMLSPDVKIFRTKVGDMHVVESLKKHKGGFGGEQSGAMIFPKISMCPDGIYAAARLLQIIESRGTFSDILSTIPQYKIKKNSYFCSYDNIEKVMEKTADGLTEMGVMNVNVLDGVRADFAGGWILVRPSGTEPKLRLTIESKYEDNENVFMHVNNIIETAICNPCTPKRILK